MSACNSVSHTLRSLEDALTRGSIHSKIITKTVAPCHSLSSALRKQLFTLHCCSLRRDLIPGKSRPRWASGLASTHAAGQRGACALPSPDHLVSRSRFIQILVAVALLAVSPSIASSTETQLPKSEQPDSLYLSISSNCKSSLSISNTARGCDDRAHCLKRSQRRLSRWVFPQTM